MNKHNSGNVYIWSDLHLGHGNVIRYCDRHFADVTEMNTALLHAWRSIVKNRDTIINLGDVSLKLNKEYLATVIQRLPGYKILVMGNHGQKKPVRWWLDAGFNEVYPRRVVYAGKYFLSRTIIDIFRGPGLSTSTGTSITLKAESQIISTYRWRKPDINLFCLRAFYRNLKK